MVSVRPRLKSIMVGLLLAHAGSLVQAQENVLDSIVVTADRQQSEVRNIPASVSSVAGDELTDIHATHVSEDLMRVPGTWISRGNGQESLIAIRSPVLSGNGSCGSFAMSQDGIPLRATGFCNVNELFESNTEQAGAIEVIRGPGSILYGANALHGAINIISDPISKKQESSVGFEFGPHEYERVSATTSDTVGDNGYRVSFNGTSDGGYKDNSGFGQQKLNMQDSYATSGGVNITSSFQYTNLNQETAGYITGHDAYKNDSLRRVNPTPESFRDARSYRVSSRIEWQSSWGDVVVTPYYRSTGMSFMQSYNPGEPIEQNGQHSVGLMTMLSGNHDRLSWQSGFDTELTSGYVLETQSVPAVGTPTIVATIPIGKHYDYAVDATLLSPYTQFKYAVTDSDHLNLGVRVEHLQYEYDNRMISGRTKDDGTPCGFGGCRFDRPASRDDTFNNASEQLGWIHDLGVANQVYGNLTNAFRAPDTNELYRLQGTQNVADLKSEKNLSEELGFRGGVGDLNYSVALFHMKKTNVILQDSNRINISGAETHHKGVEVGASYNFTKEISLAVSMTDARHKYAGNLNPGTGQTAGLDIKTAPRIMGDARLRWERDGHRFELEWVHMGAYWMDEANTARYPGHDLVNLRYQANLSAHWFYGLNVTNLFNRDYAERADYAFGVERYFVGEPRSFYVSGGYRF